MAYNLLPMGLIDDLRTVAGALDPSLAPASNEVGPLLGALIAYTEHGDKLVKAAQDDDNPAGAVSDLLAPAPDNGNGNGNGGDGGDEAKKAPPAKKAADK